jgi:hypothetical protein
VDGKFTCPGVHNCAAQLPDRHRRHDQDLVGRRLRSYSGDSLDGNLDPVRDAFANTNGNSNSNSNSNRNCNGNAYSNSDAYSNASAEAYADAQAASHTAASAVACSVIWKR